jgi:predicted nucleic acid-binding protein
MSDRFFLDTNVLVYTFDRDSPDKQTKARDLVARAIDQGSGFISFQVVQEFVNVALRKFTVPLTPQDCRAYLSTTLLPLCRVYPDGDLIAKALEVHEATGFSFYDSLIVAAAVRGGSSVLYSEDLHDGRRYEGLVIRNPF